jgi:hypothetical protein
MRGSQEEGDPPSAADAGPARGLAALRLTGPVGSLEGAGAQADAQDAMGVPAVSLGLLDEASVSSLPGAAATRPESSREPGSQAGVRVGLYSARASIPSVSSLGTDGTSAIEPQPSSEARGGPFQAATRRPGVQGAEDNTRSTPFQTGSSRGGGGGTTPGLATALLMRLHGPGSPTGPVSTAATRDSVGGFSTATEPSGVWSMRSSVVRGGAAPMRRSATRTSSRTGIKLHLLEGSSKLTM